VALAPYATSTNTTPPPKPKPPTNDTPAAALAEHLAVMNGNDPTIYAPTGQPGYVEPQYNSPIPASNSWFNPSAMTRWAPLIDKYLAQHNSPLEGLGKKFVKKGTQYGIDPRLLVAITGTETSFMTNPQAAPMSDYNAFGMGGPHGKGGIQYDSWGQGIGAAAKNLNENYFGEGLDTIKEISGKWAPLGDSRDTNHVNQNWAGNTSKFYNELTGMRPKPPALKGLAELLYQDRLWNANSGYFADADLSAAHATHVHEAATNPRILMKSLRVGQNRFGLTAGENPYVGKVYPVHAGTSAQYGDTSGSGDPSYHYRTFPGTFGPDNKPLGEAIDWTGAASDLARFNEWLTNKFVGKGAYDYGTRGVAGGSTPATAAGVPNAGAQADAAAAQNAGTAGAMISQAFAEGPGGRGKKRKRHDQDVVEQLLSNLGYGGAV